MGEPCPHEGIYHNEAGFFCLDCDEPLVLRTKTGKIITPAEMDRWVSEAEQP